MPRTPPSGFCKAVMVADMNAFLTDSGMSAFVVSSPALNKSWNNSWSSKHTRNIFVRAPSWPRRASRWCTAETLREQWDIQLNRSFKNKFWGMAMPLTWGRLPCNSANVSKILRANSAPVNSCRALDTCPCCTRLNAARPLRACS